MNQLQAFRDTVALAETRGMADKRCSAHVNLAHLRDMLATVERADPLFSDAKLGRWLGWAQASVVACGCASLDEMKQINQRHAESDMPVREDDVLIAQIRLNEGDAAADAAAKLYGR